MSVAISNMQVKKFSTVVESLVYVTNPGSDTDIKPNLQTAIDDAVDGDIVVLPSGTFKYLGTITTTKKISLRGAGKTSTILYRPESITPSTLNNVAFITFNTNTDSNSGIVVSDFTMKSQIPYGLTGYTGSEAEDKGIHFYRSHNFIVKNCRFENFGYSAIYVIHKYDLAGGVVHDCDFIHCYKGTTGLGLGYGVTFEGSDFWLSAAPYGTSNFIFVEDCFFNGCRHEAAGAGSGLYVFRYNEVYNHMLAFGAVDTHEARGESGNMYSTRAVECYYNNIHNDIDLNGDPLASPWGQPLAEIAIETRGGAMLCHNNTIEGFEIAVKLNAFWHVETGDTELVYPLTGQHGYGSGVTYGDSHTGTNANYGKDDFFMWDNTLVNYPGTSYPIECIIDTPEYLEFDRDVHLVAPTFTYTPYTYPHPLRS